MLITADGTSVEGETSSAQVSPPVQSRCPVGEFSSSDLGGHDPAHRIPTGQWELRKFKGQLTGTLYNPNGKCKQTTNLLRARYKHVRHQIKPHIPGKRTHRHISLDTPCVVYVIAKQENECM